MTAHTFDPSDWHERPQVSEEPPSVLSEYECGSGFLVSPGDRAVAFALVAAELARPRCHGERGSAVSPRKPKAPSVRHILRTCAADMTSHNGFRWPRPDEDLGHGPGVAVALDWDPSPVCGGGLHGLLDGQGDGGLLSWDATAVWLVAEVRERDVVDIDGDEVKAPDARVVFAGDRPGALAVLRSIGVTGTLHGDTATAGYGGTATAGYGGTATAGDRGTATAGDWGTATAGDWGTATAGDGGTATAGNRGTATAGYEGTATAGYGGTVIIRWCDGVRYRVAVGYVGEGVDACTAYRCDATGRLVRAQ